MDRKRRIRAQPARRDLQGLLRWWCRCDRYELRGGFIRPAPGARLEEYDPWRLYRESRPKNAKQPARPPHAELIDLVEKWVAKGTPSDPTPFTDDILQWCSRFGLLGLLQEHTVVAVLAPRWESSREEMRTVRAQMTGLVPTQTAYLRCGPFWTEQKRLAFSSTSESRRRHARGDLVSADAVPNGFEAPHAIMFSTRAGQPARKTLGEGWGRFFPDLKFESLEEAETYEYPWPNTQKFWRSYAEPALDFLRAARDLAAVLRMFRPLPEKNRLDHRTLSRLVARLNRHAATTSPAVFVDERGQLGQGWVSSSLLGNLAVMAQLDLTQGRALRSCETCGAAFTSQHDGARYCSTRCRSTSLKRRYRNRTRAKEGTATRRRRP